MPLRAAEPTDISGVPDWTDEQEIVSAFKVRYPDTQRFTYQNGATKTALDDIYISSPHAHQVRLSGIWLYSLNTGDHVGTPFVTIALDRLQRTKTHLQGKKPIKVLAVKRPTPEGLLWFSSCIAEQLEAGSQRLLPPLPEGEESNDGIAAWLHNAILNLYDCMYQAAKPVWGESCQGLRAIDRAVSIKRTTRCHGQYKNIRRPQQNPNNSVEPILRAYRSLQWPKWVIFPERILSTSPHSEGAKAINDWRRSEQPQTLPELNEWLNRGWAL
ncbi:hypothetical protein V7S43_001195 [Phytophthora oleae]|uniref:Uncharacterized protein n=1 Tax=Phytophthora oleae TaxID=2107226 RepID=A0ABD3G2Y6_9STRA